MSSETTPTEGAQSVRRALRLLETIATYGSASLEELGSAVGLSKSTAYRLLRVLQEEMYVGHEDGGGYSLGSRLVGLAAAALPEMDLYMALRPALSELMAASGETVTVHRRSGDLAVLVYGIENPHQSLRRVARLGEASPLVRGASGLAILAALDPQAAAATLARHLTAADEHAARAELNTVRARGFAVSAGANHPELSGVAAVVPATAGHADATSIAVSGPSSRWTPERIETFAPQLVEAVAAMSVLFSHARAPHVAVFTEAGVR